MNKDSRVDALEQEIVFLRRELAELRLGSASSKDSMVDRVLRDRSVLEHLPDIVSIMDREHRILYLNRTVPGRVVHTLEGTSALDSIAPDYRARYSELFEKAWQTGLPTSLEIRTISDLWWDSRLVPFRVDGEVAFMLVTSIDVTQRKRAEQALYESESRLRMALDATGMGTWTYTAATRELVWDATACEIFGIAAEQAPRSYADYLALIHPEDRARVNEAVLRCAEKGSYEDLEHRVVCRGDELRYVLSKGTVFRDEHGQVLGLCGGLFDITGRRRLEEQLNQGQKMEAIGQLTAGIAHNFNNLLSVILPNVGLARGCTGADLELCLEDIEHAARRAADMIQQLMLFARRTTGARHESVDLATVVARTAHICRSTFDRGIGIECIVESGLPTVAANAGQLEQAVLNICINARNAIEDARPDNPTIQLCLERTPAAGVRVRITDNGSGMDEQTSRRVFEPFFTTKDVGRGTGLGLASAYAIVVEHRGRISCESLLGKGTSFEIELPPAPPLTAAVEAPASVGLAPGRGETVLLIDDEPLVRRAASAMLVHGGYQVIEAHDGRDGLAKFEQARNRISVVILDRSMPGLPSEQVARRLREIDSGVPILLLSGQAGVPPGAEHAAAALVKPVDAPLLLRTIREIIDQRHA